MFPSNGVFAQGPKAACKTYPTGKAPGRPPLGLSRMLRMYVAQQCFGLSDEGMEDAVYDSHAIRRFIGIDLARAAAPDATTLLKFRRLLDAQGLSRVIFETIRDHLAREGTFVDATLIAAPPSTKNRDRARDPDVHQANKGNQWHFGMKCAHRRRPGLGAGAHGGGDVSQRQRRDPGARPAARAGNGRAG